METLINTTIKLKEFNRLLDFLDLSDVQEQLQNIHSDTVYSNVELQRDDFVLSFGIETILIISNDSVAVLDVEISDLELWKGEDQLALTDMMVIKLQKEVTKTIQNYL